MISNSRLAVREQCDARNIFGSPSVACRNALGGGYCGERSGAPLSRAELAGLVMGLVLGTLLLAAVLWCCRGFYREDELVVDTWVGRVCKCQLAAWESLINACCIATCCWLCGVQPINRVEEISKRHDL